MTETTDDKGEGPPLRVIVIAIVLGAFTIWAGVMASVLTVRHWNGAQPTQESTR